MGADLIGASLNASADPGARARRAARSGGAIGPAVDIHLDEHLEPHRMLAGMVADAVIARGLQGRVTLSHLCVLGALNPKIAGEVIQKLARAAIAVVALPETNLFLQDRDQAGPIRRGVTLVRECARPGSRSASGPTMSGTGSFPSATPTCWIPHCSRRSRRISTSRASSSPPSATAAAGSRRAGPPTSSSFAPRSFDDALARRPAGRDRVQGRPPGCRSGARRDDPWLAVGDPADHPFHMRCNAARRSRSSALVGDGGGIGATSDSDTGTGCGRAGGPDAGLLVEAIFDPGRRVDRPRDREWLALLGRDRPQLVHHVHGLADRHHRRRVGDGRSRRPRRGPA